LERTGWQPNSIVVNGKYYSFSRTDPVGMVLGFAGTVAEKLKEADHAPEDFDSWEEVLSAGISTVSASVVDKTYLTGLANVFRAIEGSDGVKTSALKWIDRQTGALVPFSTLQNTMKRFADPVTREINSPWDAIDARITGLSNRLPPARDLWGRERAPQEVYGRVYDVVSPVAVRSRTESPIDTEMVALDMGQERIAKRSLFAGAMVNFRDHPEAYDQYVRLAGNDLKLSQYGGLGAFDYLNAVVTGQHFMSGRYAMASDGPEGGKAAFIQNTISTYRKAAQQQIMADPRFADFADFVDGEARKRAAKRFPLGPQIMSPPEIPRLRLPVPGAAQ
jgi:hypothetical protein